MIFPFNLKQGWSTTVPNYNPLDIIKNLKFMIEGKEEEMIEMTPWYRGFTGTITKNTAKASSYDITGIHEWIDDSTIHVSELPAQVWTQSYKEFIERHIVGANTENSKIKEFVIDYNDNSTATLIDFTVSIATDMISELKKKGLEKSMKLKSSIATSNLVMFDQNGKIKRYNDVKEILKEFYDLRLDFYGKRKEHMINKLKREFDMLDNKVRFLLAIIEEKLVINKKKKVQLVKELISMKFTPFQDEKKKRIPLEGEEGDNENEEEEEEVKDDTGKGFDYLLRMPLWNLTYEKIEKLKKQKSDKSDEIEELKKITPKMLWLEDLNKLEVAIQEHYYDIENDEEEETEGKGKKKKTTKKKLVARELLKGSSGKDVKKEKTTKKETTPKKKESTKKSTKKTTKKEAPKKESPKTTKTKETEIQKQAPKKTLGGAPKKQPTLDGFLKPKPKEVIQEEEEEDEDDDISDLSISFDTSNVSNINISKDDPLHDILETPKENKRKRDSNDNNSKKKIKDDEDDDLLVSDEDD